MSFAWDPEKSKKRPKILYIVYYQRVLYTIGYYRRVQYIVQDSIG